ncbi:hypothetical protein C8R47DRAFT_111010 [Mycena vitilis]|nr:hypothetical protein C8R47DRAFT_111010 [Mycena vitilis]
MPSHMAAGNMARDDDPEARPLSRYPSGGRKEDTVFQVSRAVLGATSGVFSGMIAFPQPTTQDTELIDGSPVVRSSADVDVFLRAL